MVCAVHVTGTTGFLPTMAYGMLSLTLYYWYYYCCSQLPKHHDSTGMQAAECRVQPPVQLLKQPPILLTCRCYSPKNNCFKCKLKVDGYGIFGVTHHSRQDGSPHQRHPKDEALPEA